MILAGLLFALLTPIVVVGLLLLAWGMCAASADAVEQAEGMIRECEGRRRQL